MATTPLHTPEEPRRPVIAVPDMASGGQGLSDPAEIVRVFNAANGQHEDLWSRIQHSVDATRRLTEQAHAANARADNERLAHLAIQAEDPERRALRARQLALAAITLGLDAVACDFAAQALGNGQQETLAWTGLFLAVLAGGELALDFYRDRRRGVWRGLAVGLCGFVAGLGALRYSYLLAVGAEGPGAALIGAALFTVATILFVLAGYWALRRAETPAAAKARRKTRHAAREARAAVERASRCAAKRDRLLDAYLVRVKAGPLRSCSAAELPVADAAVRAHLLGQEAA